MDIDGNSAMSDYECTRKRLAEGTLVKLLHANPLPGARSDAELQSALDDALRTHDAGQDLLVFGYGSLMWNPAMDAIGSCIARVQGWHRRFCLRAHLGRGTPLTPGAMLALDRGGACRGMLYRIAAQKVAAELHLLWRREMVSGTYNWRWVEAEVGGQRLRAMTFVVKRDHARYIGRREPIEAVAHLVRTGTGRLGTSRAYFDATVETLARLGIHDTGIQRLRCAVARADDEVAGLASAAPVST